MRVTVYNRHTADQAFFKNNLPKKFKAEIFDDIEGAFGCFKKLAVMDDGQLVILWYCVGNKCYEVSYLNETK